MAPACTSLAAGRGSDVTVSVAYTVGAEEALKPFLIPSEHMQQHSGCLMLECLLPAPPSKSRRPWAKHPPSPLLPELMAFHQPAAG